MGNPTLDAETLAKRRFLAMNAARMIAFGAVLLGIAGARGVAPLPYSISVILAVAGLVAFFFAPPLLARRFKRLDKERGEA